MNRLIENTVFSGFMTAWRLATVPTSRSSESVNATTDGVVRPPSAFSRTVASPPSITATQEFVVPRSIPIVFATAFLLLSLCLRNLSARLADQCVSARVVSSGASSTRSVSLGAHLDTPGPGAASRGAYGDVAVGVVWLGTYAR